MSTYKHPNPHNGLPQIERDFLKASTAGDKEKVKKILEEDISLIDKKNTSGRTALMYAAMYGQKAMVTWLLKKGATLEERDDGGRTALIWAAADGNVFVAERLLDKGADINMKDDHGRTALMEAALHGYNATVHMLLKRGADVNAESDSGETALSEAKRGGKTEIVQMLGKWSEQKRQQQIVEKAAKEAQYLEDTDFHGGLKKPMRATRPFFPRKP